MYAHKGFCPLVKDSLFTGINIAIPQAICLPTHNRELLFPFRLVLINVLVLHRNHSVTVFFLYMTN